MKEMIPLEEARALVIEHVRRMPIETVGILDAVGRVAARDLASDIDVAPFAHSAMDGFAARASQLAHASEEHPVVLHVIAEVAAGSVYEGEIAEGECVRIMTGAPLPDAADSVVKYELTTTVEGDGRTGSRVSFTQPTKLASNVRAAGEEAKAGEVIVHAGEIVNAAGVGFLAGCGVTQVETYQRPRVAIIATGSELVDPTEKPTAGKIRNSNSYALAACARAAGAIPTIMPIARDEYEVLRDEVEQCTRDFDFVVTSGGAANGDFDFIKQVVDDLGELLMVTVNMRPGKAQTFGLVNGTPVFGLAGNPAAAYLGFEMIIRAGLRAMQGYTHFDRPAIKARLTEEYRKKDPRRIYLRSTLTKVSEGSYEVTPAKNQSSGLFGPIQRCNCFAVMPEGLESKSAGDIVDCVLVDVSEEESL